jgi:hypothetical protein
MAGKFTNPLNNIKIASPCAANWEEMFGDERKRFCGECKLNVYNLSGISRREAENLILQSEGRLCVRFYKRADGSVLTKDCPVGWQAIKRNVSKTVTAFVSLLFAILSGIGLANYFAKSEINTPTTGTMIPINKNSTRGETAVDGSNTNTAIQEMPVMGQMVVNRSDYELGKMEVIGEVRTQVKKRRK